MGATSSTQRRSEEQNQNRTTEEPRSGGQNLEIGPHGFPVVSSQQYYLMFGGPPLLFGDESNSQDVQTIQSILFPQRQLVPQPKFQETVTVRNDVNLLKHTMRLTSVAANAATPSSSESQPTKYLLEFDLDTTSECDVSVYFFAKESISGSKITLTSDYNKVSSDTKGKKHITASAVSASTPAAVAASSVNRKTAASVPGTVDIAGSPPVTVQRFPVGSGQHFTQAVETALDMERVRSGDFSLTYRTAEAPDLYPVVVVLKPLHREIGSGSTSKAATTTETTAASDKRSPVTYQITYAEIIAKPTTTSTSADTVTEYIVKPLKQKIQVDGQIYELHEIYGIDDSAANTAATAAVIGDANDSSDDALCVVCMSEPRNTTALPCRHMCLCSACAQLLRFQSNRCPICRSVIDSMLVIKKEHTADTSTPSSSSQAT